MAHRHGESDGAAPVLNHQGDALQAQLAYEPLHYPGVLSDGVAVSGRPGRQAKPRVVKGDAAELVLETANDVPVQKRPGGIAVQPEEHRSLAFVDVVDPRAVDLYEVAVEREQFLVHPCWPRRHAFLLGLPWSPVSQVMAHDLKIGAERETSRRTCTSCAHKAADPAACSNLDKLEARKEGPHARLSDAGLRMGHGPPGRSTDIDKRRAVRAAPGAAAGQRGTERDHRA
jgi:hypothetical protein